MKALFTDRFRVATLLLAICSQIVPFRSEAHVLLRTSNGAAALVTTTQENDPPSDAMRVEARKASSSLIRHMYYVYFGLRACWELQSEKPPGSFVFSVTLSEVRSVMHQLDAEAKTAAIDTDGIWAEAAPGAMVTAESVKTLPSPLDFCRKLGGIFRGDVSNLQAALRTLGIKNTLIPKDF